MKKALKKELKRDAHVILWIDEKDFLNVSDFKETKDILQGWVTNGSWYLVYEINHKKVSAYRYEEDYWEQRNPVSTTENVEFLKIEKFPAIYDFYGDDEDDISF